MTIMAGIDPKEARKTVFLTPDAKTVLTPKAAEYTAVQGKAELTVTYKPGTKLKAIRQLLDGNRCYAAEECLDHILSGEEVADREDPNRGTDAYLFTEPELDEEKVSALDMEEKMDRFAWFVAVANKVAQEDILTFILENAPKKKNGTFAKNKLTVVAALPIVFGSWLGYYEIVGKAKTDNLIELTIQERRFSEDEWLRSKDNVYLHYIAGGYESGSAKPVPRKIKIRHINQGHKITIEIPAIQMEGGQLAIDAKPYRPISGFSCVTGNDQKGYEIMEPPSPALDCVCYNGVTTALQWELPKSANGIWRIVSSLEDSAKYIRTGKKAYLMHTEMFTCGRDGEKIPERCLTENYIAENANQLLCVMEMLNKHLASPALAEEIGGSIKRDKDGNITKYGVAVIAIPNLPGRERPLVSCRLVLLNQMDGTVKVQYELLHRRGDDWSEYQDA